MNAYVEHQTSGQHWSLSQRAGTLIEQLARDSSRPVILGRPPIRQEHVVLEEFERQMRDFAAEREAAVVKLRKSFVLPTGSSVTSFLFQHRTLAPLLLEAVPELRKFFGQETVFQLRVPLDPFGSQTLYAVAIWPGAAMDVRRALESFDEAWWLPRSHRAAGFLTFTYELV